MPLTKIQARERAKRNQNRLNMMGMHQPPGSKPRPPRERLPAKPAWVPGPQRGFSLTDFMAALSNKFTPPWARRSKADVFKELHK